MNTLFKDCVSVMHEQMIEDEKEEVKETNTNTEEEEEEKEKSITYVITLHF